MEKNITSVVQSSVIRSDAVFSSVCHFSLYFPLFSAIQVGMTTDETNGFIWRITQFPSASAPARLSEINLNLAEQCCNVTVHLTGIEVFSSCPVSRWDPPPPLPLHPITHPFRAVKAQSSSGPHCYDPPGLGSDEAQFREHTERLCLADTHTQSHYETSVDMR